MMQTLIENINAWRRSMSGQMILRFILCLSIFFFLIGFIQYFSLKYALYDNLEQSLRNDIKNVQSHILEWYFSGEIEPFQYTDMRAGKLLALYMPNGQQRTLIFSYDADVANAAIFLKLDSDELRAQAGRKAFILKGNDGESYMFVVTAVLLNLTASEYGFLVIMDSMLDEQILLSDIYSGYLFSAMLVLMLSIIITYLFVQRSLDPISLMSKTLRRIASGHYDMRIAAPEGGATELQQLSTALNQMLNELEKALRLERLARERMAHFIGDASHELRTPLTSIRGYLEILMRSGNPDPDVLREVHQSMYSESERLIRMTEGLLSLNRLAYVEKLEEEEMNGAALGEVLDETLPLLQSLLGDRELLLNGEKAQRNILSPVLQIIFPLKKDECKQVLYNLVNNAIQHTADDGVIEIAVAETEWQLLLAVKDNGQGIASDDIPYLFDRFYRGEHSRAHRQGQGAGLGLSIVAEIIRLRGGQIRAESDVGRGTGFFISFEKEADKP